MGASLPRNALVKPRPRPKERQGSAGPDKHRWRDQSWWPWAKRILSAAFFALVVYLLWRYARNIQWGEVWESVKETPAPMLALAVPLAATSHLLYSCFDLIGRRYTGHDLPVPTTMAVNFTSYAFNLCLGSLVGGVAFRYRLYSRFGLKNGVITRVLTISMLTNWVGYMLVAGLLFLLQPLELPPSWKMGNHGLQWIGAALVAAALGYLAACVVRGGQTWDWRGHELYLPRWRMAVFQLVISVINWCVIGSIIWVLLAHRVAYHDVLSVLLIGAIAGVIAHVPAGLGVLEFVFVSLLGHLVGEPRLIAALLVYRAIYYILPLAIASVLYLLMELHAKRSGQAARPQGSGA